MFALVIMKKKEEKVDVKLFQSREQVEKEMILLYNTELRRASEIDWRYTFFDSKKWYASVDDWVDRVEYACCEA